MSEIRVNRITSNRDKITFTGITTFSGTGCVSLPSGTISNRESSTPKGGIRRVNGDIKSALEYYDGEQWITISEVNNTNPDGVVATAVFAGGVGAPAAGTMDFVTIATEGYNASSFGTFGLSSHESGACSSTTRGIFAGGDTPTVFTSAIHYITFTSSGTSLLFANLTRNVQNLDGCSNNTRGVFAAGSGADEPAALTFTSVVEYITIATSANAISFGNLTTGRYDTRSCSSSTRGIFGGGNIPATLTSNIEYVSISTLGDRASFGSLTGIRTAMGSCSSSTRGLFAGGITPTITSVIDFITIATTGSTSSFGNLSNTRTGTSGDSSSVRGLFSGGATPVNSSVMDFVTIASSGTATTFGNLTAVRTLHNTCSNNHGGLIPS